MFHSARIKLTAYYLLIIMTVSIMFSLVVYRGLTLEIARGMRFQALRSALREEIPRENFEKPTPRHFFFDLPVPENPSNLPSTFHQQTFEEARHRVALQLIFINLGIFVISGAAGYFLAGKTLKPIAEMVEEQKRFVADASHELRTPLTAAKTEAEVALRDKKLSLKSAKELLKSNLEEINSLETLTSNLLSLAQYQENNHHLVFESVNLKELIEETCRKILPMAKRKNIKVKIEAKEVAVEADREGMAKMMTVFLDNAVKYTPEEGEIFVAAELKNRQAIIKIRDTGIGIAKEHLPHIFDRFYRADASRSKKETDGFGLGLAVAKKIIERHKGTIEVKSKVGKGTTFTIKLPLR